MLSPFMLDENLERRNKQPKYVREKSISDVSKVINVIAADGGSKFKTDSMLKSCGGELRKNLTHFQKNLLPNKSEKLVHQCRFLHHSNPFTALGPFKLEIVHHAPFIMIFHEIFTEEDCDYLVEWAKPRLSRKREVVLDEDQKKTKNEYLTRTTVSIKGLVLCNNNNFLDKNCPQKCPSLDAL